MSKCIEYNCPPIQLLSQQISNGRRAITSLSGSFNSRLNEHRRRYGITVISSKVLLTPPLKMEAFPTSSSLSLASVAKPADPMVLLQTSALMIFVYIIANFVVPELLSKSMGYDKVDENDKPSTSTSNSSSIDSQNVEKANPTSKKPGFNSSKPK